MSTDWRDRGERGNLLWLLFVRSVALLLGRRIARLTLYPAVAWYLLRARAEQQHVKEFLARTLTRQPRFSDVVRTYWSFASVTLDRVFLLAGRERCLDIRVHGTGPLLRQQKQRRGALLLGAHLGSFEAMRALGVRRKGLPIRILQYTEQNPRMTRVLSALAPELADSVIPLGEPDVLLRLAQCIAAGDFVAVLADRVGRDDTRAVQCDFLGAPTQFPTGVMDAALILGCPVFFFAALYRGGNRYDLHFELLSEARQVPRGERAREVRHLAARYAACLERHARDAPYNWFNIYSYWSAGGSSPQTGFAAMHGGQSSG